MSKELSIAIQAGTPVLLWGSPGTGKTSKINALSVELDRHVECVIASIREPADFGGLPVLEEAGVHLHAPAWAHRLAEAGNGILFIDEISTAAPATQAALLRVVLDRVVGDLPLPVTTAVVAAANPPAEAAGAYLSVVILFFFTGNPFWLLSFATLPLVIRAVNTAAKYSERPIPRFIQANINTIKTYQLTGLSMVVAGILMRYFTVK